MKKAHDELPEDNAAMWAELEKRADRIEALEAALRKIADSLFTGETAWRQSAKIAKAALAPEQDK